jgi:hypothetical protein
MVIIDPYGNGDDSSQSPESAQFPVLDENMAREIQEKGPIDEHHREDMNLLVRGCHA